ncbi:hypothetical protein [Synechococcus sp. PCC 6312]|uniref:hypothetical protein n=1 Tax=Synechococcus sp. (strain ATCC 27167 / PCC 6312) TaxID=195253 RepID=UPI00029EFF2A|nr:hypothetical protein [Synechococcus sp. PCC 6312]AFY61828.1 hypothetical protein Syn6312_2748 [Synechococcus sp. PCC 6312]
MFSRNKYKAGDRIISLEKAKVILETELGIKGWRRNTIKQKIRTGWKFKWIEGVHYINSSRGLAALNIDAIKREILK